MGRWRAREGDLSALIAQRIDPAPFAPLVPIAAPSGESAATGLLISATSGLLALFVLVRVAAHLIGGL